MKRENEFLFKLLLSQKEIDGKFLNELNFENIIKIGSLNLILPSIYINLLKKSYLNKIEKKAADYLKFIFEQNLNRNKILISEISEISEILILNKIEHIFIKGSAHIFSNIYTDIGERMLSDIDILVPDSLAKKTQDILKRSGYFEIKKNIHFEEEFRHLSRLVNNEKIFAIEVHKKIINNENLINLKTKDLLENKISFDGVSVPAINHQLLINIYNHQINDRGYFKSDYNFRNLYDTFCLTELQHTDFDKIIVDKYTKNYYYICNKLNLKYFNKKRVEINIIQMLKFKFFEKGKNSKKIIFMIDNFYNYLQIKIIQLKKIFKSKEYRNFIWNKLNFFK